MFELSFGQWILVGLLSFSVYAAADILTTYLINKFDKKHGDKDRGEIS